MNFRVPQKAGNLLIGCVTISSWRRALLHGISWLGLNFFSRKLWRLLRAVSKCLLLCNDFEVIQREWLHCAPKFGVGRISFIKLCKFPAWKGKHVRDLPLEVELSDDVGFDEQTGSQVNWMTNEYPIDELVYWVFTFRCVQTGSEDHPAYNIMGTGGSSSGNRAAGAWSWPLSYISCRCQECVELYRDSPIHLQLKHRGNFT